MYLSFSCTLIFCLFNCILAVIIFLSLSCTSVSVFLSFQQLYPFSFFYSCTSAFRRFNCLPAVFIVLTLSCTLAFCPFTFQQLYSFHFPFSFLHSAFCLFTSLAVNSFFLFFTLIFCSYFPCNWHLSFFEFQFSFCRFRFIGKCICVSFYCLELCIISRFYIFSLI